jgi:hypothetical protein
MHYDNRMQTHDSLATVDVQPDDGTIYALRYRIPEFPSPMSSGIPLLHAKKGEELQHWHWHGNP